MREERLIERIRLGEKEPVRRATQDPKKVMASVLRHLQKILNTRQGGVPIADDYGVPDFTDFMRVSPDALREVEKSIRNTIQKYEPRLNNVRVKFIPQEDDILSLSFQIVAKLLVENKKTPIVFESLMGYDGKIRIRS